MFGFHAGGEARAAAPPENRGRFRLLHADLLCDVGEMGAALGYVALVKATATPATTPGRAALLAACAILEDRARGHGAVPPARNPNRCEIRFDASAPEQILRGSPSGSGRRGLYGEPSNRTVPTKPRFHEFDMTAERDF